MARSLMGVTRARTVVHKAAPARDAVAAPPRPDLDSEPDGTFPVGGLDGASARAGRPETPGPDAGAAAGDDAAAGGAGGGRSRFLRRPGGGDRAGFDVRNSWQVIAGSFLVPAGVVIILIAWYGAAHTRYVQQQIPYLVSGAFIGLGCMVLGGLLYWAHWLYRLYDQADLNHEEMMKAFEQTLRVVADRLAAPDAAGAAVPAPASGAPASTGAVPSAPAAAGAGPTTIYVATATGSVYHLPGCPVVAHHGDGLRVLGPGELAAMEPCRICLAPNRPRLGA